ncbi:MAG: cytochrome c oxidase subunit 3 [Gemmatimonadetes bacterium]|nr:cytochrome c oxidase subunit 3 [Gemmatimonadota bacterium]
MSEPRAVIDVSGLPDVAFGSKNAVWWGTLGFMLIEGSTLAICAVTYFYLRRNFDPFPPGATPPPDLPLPTLSLLALLASLAPATLTSRAAKRFDAAGVRRWLAVGLVVMTAAVVLRALEFPALNTRWKSDAYGSIAWFTLGFHLSLLVVNLAESVVIAAIFFLGRAERKHFSDAADDACYWFFVVLVWVPLYVTVYLTPRFL